MNKPRSIDPFVTVTVSRRASMLVRIAKTFQHCAAGEFSARCKFNHLLLILSLVLLVLPSNPVLSQDRQDDGRTFDCLIQPKQTLKLGTQVPGLIAEVMVDRGAIIKKGDVVARLESSVEMAAMALAEVRAANESPIRSAEVKLEFQLRKEKRLTELRKSDSTSAATADEAETQAKVAKTELDEAKINLRLAQVELNRTREVLRQRTILSPIDGVVVARTLGPGEYAYDQAHLFTVAQIDPLNVEVYVPVQLYGKVHTGTVAEVYPEYPVGSHYHATVTVVDQVFDAASGTVGVRLDLPNANLALPAGVKCRVRFPEE